MKNFVQRGDTVPVVSPTTAKSGDLIMVGAIKGVCAVDAAVGDSVEVQVTGVFDLKKISADTLAPGALAKVDANGVVATAGVTNVGWVLVASGPGQTTVRVRLCPSV